MSDLFASFTRLRYCSVQFCRAPSRAEVVKAGWLNPSRGAPGGALFFSMTFFPTGARSPGRWAGWPDGVLRARRDAGNPGDVAGWGW